MSFKSKGLLALLFVFLFSTACIAGVDLSFEGGAMFLPPNNSTGYYGDIMVGFPFGNIFGLGIKSGFYGYMETVGVPLLIGVYMSLNRESGCFKLWAGVYNGTAVIGSQGEMVFGYVADSDLGFDWRYIQKTGNKTNFIGSYTYSSKSKDEPALLIGIRTGYRFTTVSVLDGDNYVMIGGPKIGIRIGVEFL